MGTPDTFGENFIQLKNGECICGHYRVGEQVPLDDGIYIGFEGAVVVQDGIFAAEFPIENVLNKWGGQISIDASNPLKQAADKMIAKHKQT